MDDIRDDPDFQDFEQRVQRELVAAVPKLKAAMKRLEQP